MKALEGLREVLVEAVDAADVGVGRGMTTVAPLPRDHNVRNNRVWP